jgi:hypothetical protein
MPTVTDDISILKYYLLIRLSFQAWVRLVQQCTYLKETDNLDEVDCRFKTTSIGYLLGHATPMCNPFRGR